MFRKNLLFALVMSFSASAFALVGGPFDNGDYSELLDQNGIYQWVASMSNGLGEGQFNDTVSVGATITSSTSDSSNTTNNAIGSVQDRSIFYYKGVTFFGQCFGEVDLSSKTISCITNGSSQSTISNTGSSNTTTGNTTATGITTGSVSATATVVNNGNLGFVSNSEWNGKITSTNPTLVFHGSGQFSVISPSAHDIIGGLAQTIVSSNNTSTVTIGGGTAVGNALQALSSPSFVSAIQPDTIDTVGQNSDFVDIDVTGSRKYFLGQ